MEEQKDKKDMDANEEQLASLFCSSWAYIGKDANVPVESRYDINARGKWSWDMLAC